MTKGYWLVGLFHQSNALWIFCSTLFTLHALTFPMNFSLEQQDQQRQAQSNISENPNPRKGSMKSDEQRQQESDIKKSSPTEPQRETSKYEEGASQEIARNKEAMDPSEKKLEQSETFSSEPVRETTK